MVDSKLAEALAENERLSAMNEKLEMQIDDVEGLLKEVSDIAYDKACETLIDEITDKTREEDIAEIDAYKKWIMSDEREIPKEYCEFTAKCMTQLQIAIRNIKDKVVAAVKKAFVVPEKKEKFTKEIVEKARPSTLELLRQHKAKIAEENAKRICFPKHNRRKMSR